MLGEKVSIVMEKRHAVRLKGIPSKATATDILNFLCELDISEDDIELLHKGRGREVCTASTGGCTAVVHAIDRIADIQVTSMILFYFFIISVRYKMLHVSISLHARRPDA